MPSNTKPEKTFFSDFDIRTAPAFPKTALAGDLVYAYRKAASEIRQAGFRVSAGSWIDFERNCFCVFSIESWGPGTYGSPKMCISGNLT